MIRGLLLASWLLRRTWLLRNHALAPHLPQQLVPDPADTPTSCPRKSGSVSLHEQTLGKSTVDIELDKSHSQISIIRGWPRPTHANLKPRCPVCMNFWGKYRLDVGEELEDHHEIQNPFAGSFNWRLVGRRRPLPIGRIACEDRYSA